MAKGHHRWVRVQIDLQIKYLDFVISRRHLTTYNFYSLFKGPPYNLAKNTI